MDCQTILIIAIVITLVIMIAASWKKYPRAKFVVLSRTDGDTSKYTAINNIEVIDSNGIMREIIAIEGRGAYLTAYSNSTAATASAAATTATGGDVALNGRTMGYVKDTLFAGTPVAPTAAVVGPVIGFIPSSQSAAGYVLFSIGCPVRVARVNVKAPDDEISRTNLQKVKVYLLDNDKNIIAGSEQVIPVSSTIPQTIHHITFK